MWWLEWADEDRATDWISELRRNRNRNNHSSTRVSITRRKTTRSPR